MNPDDLAKLLASGGDDRLVLDTGTGLNMYGHGPVPRPSDIAMGSSTASTISDRAFAAAQDVYARLQQDIAAHGGPATYRAGMARVRERIGAVLGCQTDILLSPSGTDIHLLAASLLKRERQGLLTITLEGSETGSSVGTASAGRHFMHHLPSGAEVAQGTPVAKGNANLTLAVRDETGALRDEDEIERQIDSAIRAALVAGSDCLLVVADVTKTGLIAPGLDTMFRLKTRYGARLTVMVDACQLRLSPATLRAYLAHDLLVAITGSKFLGGPVFSGALLCPPAMARQLCDRRLPQGMGDYFAAADFPEDWTMRDIAPDRANIGLLLRWEAALFEWERLLAIPSSDIARVTNAFAQSVEQRLRRDDAFAQIAMQPLDRRALRLPASEVQAYDGVPTIFPFLLAKRDAGGRRTGFLSADEMRTVYDRLADGRMAGPAIRLGQPVACGQRLGTKVAALRLCLSARLIADACESMAAQDALLADADHALDMAALAAGTAGKLPWSRAA